MGKRQQQQQQENKTDIDSKYMPTYVYNIQYIVYDCIYIVCAIATQILLEFYTMEHLQTHTYVQIQKLKQCVMALVRVCVLCSVISNKTQSQSSRALSRIPNHLETPCFCHRCCCRRRRCHCCCCYHRRFSAFIVSVPPACFLSFVLSLLPSICFPLLSIVWFNVWIVSSSLILSLLLFLASIRFSSHPNAYTHTPYETSSFTICV